MSVPTEKDNQFTLHPFTDREWIVQGADSVPSAFNFALARKLADSAYLVVVIDKDDADEATRKLHCVEQSRYSCRIETPEQLLAFARATAAKTRDSGGLAVVVPDAKP
jgi:hypothetical protein